MKKLSKRALDYHKGGKLSVQIRKKMDTQDDLGLAYTPGVADVCREIVRDKNLAYKYTNKWNSVAVITDGTAVLGLGNIGPLASIPVMEGKAVLFKKFAGVDAWSVPIAGVRIGKGDGKLTNNISGKKELINYTSGDHVSSKTDIEKFIFIAKAVSLQYGGINLEDIAAPACFEIEERLKKELDIPVFHDDQHGTAIVTLAAIMNYLRITSKKISDIKIVILGAGAAGISVASLLRYSGAKKIILCDSKGVIHSGRKDLNRWKQKFAVRTDARTPEDAFVGADVFIGVSRPGIVTKDMIASMAENPAVFPMSNPVAEIWPKDVREIRDDAIIATGRSDSANQVNNVLVFPYIFRGALDTQASDINYDMYIAAADALAEVARKKVPKKILESYGLDSLEFGRDYFIPKPFDKRVFVNVSHAVAKAAIESGVARKKIDLDKYKKKLIETDRH